MQSAVTGQPSNPPQTAQTRQDAVGRTLIWIGALIVLTVAAGLVLLWYRRRLLSRTSDADHGGLMEQFRRMRDSGEITHEEYEATRRAMVARLSGNAPRAMPKPVTSQLQGPDNTPTDERPKAGGQ